MKRFLLFLPLIAIVGCSSNTTSLAPVNTSNNASSTQTPSRIIDVPNPDGTPPSPDAPATQNTATQNAATQAAPNTQVPQGMAMSTRMTLTPTPDLDKKIAAALKTNDKKKIAQAYAERGTFRMNDTDASPKVIYRAALQDYRVALKNDPNNAEAKTNKQLIESIYKSMGRPVPTA